MEVINSFFSNIKNKLTNPFFGTLILVLLFHHWELIYSIFIFDKDCNMNDKLFFIQDYINHNITISSLLFDLASATFFMFFGYLIIILTRGLVMWIEHKIMPYVTKKVVSNEVVLKTEYDTVVEERDENFKKYEEQRDKVRKYSSLIDEQQDQINTKDINISNLNEKIIEENDKFGIRESKLLSEVRGLRKDYQEKLKILETEKDDVYEDKVTSLENIKNEYENILLSVDTKVFFNDSKDRLPPVIFHTMNKLIEEKKFTSFFQFVDLSKKAKLEPNIRQSYNLKMIDTFKKMGLISLNSNSKFIEVSVLGNIIYEYRNMFI